MKLDIGCGANKREGFTGVDQYQMPGVDIVCDLKERWPFDDESVDEVFCSHVIEHFSGLERVHFMNELYRVMKPGATALLVFPHWSAGRAYGDPTHQWPPMSEFWFNYLSREWRIGNPDKGIPAQAPHTDKSYWAQGYDCNFEWAGGHTLCAEWYTWHEDRQKFAASYYIEVKQDVGVTLTRR